MKTTLDELEAFTRVVDTGSITAAAGVLEQTVSAVSRSLSRLEAKLEVTLLRRTTRRIELTEEGALFLGQARGILNAVAHAEEQINIRRNKPAGKLRVNAAAPYILHVIVPLIAGFRARYPDIELELNSGDHIIDLLEQRTDVALRIGVLTDSSLHARPLGNSRIRVLASPAYLRQAGTPKTVEDLAQHALLGFTEPDSLNIWPFRRQPGDQQAIKPTLRASSGETLRQLALAGNGLVCLSDFMTEVDRQRGDLVQVLASETIEVSRPVNAVYYRNTALASRITCFLDYISEHLDPSAAIRK